MSKYKEVVEIAKSSLSHDCPTFCEACKKPCGVKGWKKELDELEAIADRLEQADVIKCEDDFYSYDFFNYDDSEYGQGYKNGFQHGYNAALADLRGSNDE